MSKKRNVGIDLDGDQFFGGEGSLEELGFSPKKDFKHKKKKELKGPVSVNEGIYAGDYSEPSDNSQNPFQVGDKVRIITKNKRYKEIENFDYNMIGNVSKIFDNEHIDIGFWDTNPGVIKKIPLKHVELVSKAVILEPIPTTQKDIEIENKTHSDPLSMISDSYIDEVIVKPKRYNKGSMEVWDVWTGLDLGPFEANIVKYISRYKDKGGDKDLKKALTYLVKLYSIETGEDFNFLLESTVGDILK